MWRNKGGEMEEAMVHDTLLVVVFNALLSSLTHLSILFDLNWGKQRMAPFNNIHWILGNLETLKIPGINEDIFDFISCVDNLHLHSLVAALSWEAPRPAASICNVISSLMTLSLIFIVSDRPDDPINVEILLEPFGHATSIMKLSIKLQWWTLGWTLDANVAELLKNFPLLETNSCPKLKRIKFVGNINITLLNGPVMDSFTKQEELDFGKSNAKDKYHR
ncbi:hypothetical protein K443DRAFT_122803 [Laccaria amethystina LaAM-08-1]|uniref:Uncharacterized protein n=1 Tax=Laccaria amethystina LaAM-08-1 TaxID=1095629 RepID=A0A0C9X5Y1_9AGAR|nr:hypothetical protein K443DRAFT_122803 [Laccaria amethystina LaAM-08-1]